MRLPSMTKALKARLLTEHDLDVLLAQPGRAQERSGIVAHHLLDLGIADDRHPALTALRRCGRDGESGREEAGKAERRQAGRGPVFAIGGVGKAVSHSEKILAAKFLAANILAANILAAKIPAEAPGCEASGCREIAGG
jgi:hypothetical protein